MDQIKIRTDKSTRQPPILLFGYRVKNCIGWLTGKHRLLVTLFIINIIVTKIPFKMYNIYFSFNEDMIFL